MTVSMHEWARGRDVVGGLLEELRLDAYRFEVEPQGEGWVVRVECAVREGWMSRDLAFSRADLLHGAGDAAERRRLLDRFSAALCDCLRSS